MNPIVTTVHLVLMPKRIVYLLKLEEARKWKTGSIVSHEKIKHVCVCTRREREIEDIHTHVGRESILSPSHTHKCAHS